MKDSILKECKKTHNYNDNVIWKMYIPNNLCDHDKKIIDITTEDIQKCINEESKINIRNSLLNK